MSVASIVLSQALHFNTPRATPAGNDEIYSAFIWHASYSGFMQPCLVSRYLGYEQGDIKIILIVVTITVHILGNDCPWCGNCCINPLYLIILIPVLE